jgi:diguanylate cyclase (GGDEF)-like protein
MASQRKRGTTWVDAVIRWVQAEIAMAGRDWDTAESNLREMTVIASNCEHEQLACMAHLLIAQLFEVQGKQGQAFREYRSLRKREQRICAEGLASRELVVNWQLGARESEQNVQELLVASRQFERWSLEDGLTGIANRRCFEQKLAARLRTSNVSEQPLSVAMIDVDKFKAVNDRFTHLVGDHVLKALAGIFASQVREKDLPARLAGDEFAVLFDGADVQMAMLICERIQASVALFDWEVIATGLQVTVSIGVSQAIEGDTGEALLHRSDKSMYKSKPTPLLR